MAQRSRACNRRKYLNTRVQQKNHAAQHSQRSKRPQAAVAANAG